MRHLLTLVCLMAICSCSKDDDAEMVTCTNVCKTLDQHLALMDHKSTDIDTIIVSTYNNDSSFTNPVSEELQFPRSYRTRDFTVTNAFMNFTIATDRNYEFIIPATADTYRIWNIHIIERTDTYPCSASSKSRPTSPCANQMALRATLNGELVQTVSSGYSVAPTVMFLEFKK